MPAIVVFGRRWSVGSDDFVFPAAGEIVLRAVWLTALSLVLGIHSESLSSCLNGYLLKIYLIGMLTILSLTLIMTAVIMYLSMQGSIRNDVPRRHVPNLIIFKLLLFLIEIAWTGIGTYWSFGEDVQNCSHVVVIVVKIATVVGWILLLCLFIGLFMVFDSLGHQESQHTQTTEQLQRIWKQRCKLLCCCCCVGMNDGTGANTFEDVARLLANHLYGVNFVMTDAVAAMLLVQKEQIREQQNRKRRQLQNRKTDENADRVPYVKALMMSNAYFQPKDWMTISNAAAFMIFALASYGWPFFVYSKHVTGPIRLWCRCKCCFCLRPSDNIHGDNCCGCNTSAILEQTNINRQDIFYANYNNRLYEIPFYIVHDHEHKSVVLSIRGTLSFQDVLTDMLADVEEMSVNGLTDVKAHKGILQAAKYIERMVNQNNLLDKALAKTPDYQLVIVGHSLGAGAAAILSILLKPKYTTLKCFAYSPPGWLISLPLSRYAEEFICSVVTGTDLIPRLGMVTIDQLKLRMIDAVSRSNIPKYQILAGGVWKTIFSCVEAEEGIEDVEDLDEHSREPLLSGRSTLLNYTDEQRMSADRVITSHSEDETFQALVEFPLYLPGQVLFLQEVEAARNCCGVATYTAFWMKPESFDEILVSGVKMLHDHMPNVVYKALKSIEEDLHTRAEINYSNPSCVI